MQSKRETSLVLLVKPPSLKSPDEESKGLYPPLGLLYLAASLKIAGYDVKVYDLDLERPSRLLNDVSSESPVLVGFTTTTPAYHNAVALMRAVRSCSDSAIAVGGPHATLVPEDFIGLADFIVVGEGETVIVELAREASKGLPCERGKSRIIKGKPVRNLDKLPLPDRDVIDLNAYGENSGALFTSRGCPYNCLFCTTRYILGRKFRALSAAKVLEEWRIVMKRYRAPKVRIVDDVFSLNRSRAVEICRGVLEEELRPWSLPNGVRVDNVDEELLKLMAESGLTTIWYGVESGSERVLKVLRKGISLERVVKVVKWTKDVGVSVGLFFMVGAPGEDLEAVRMTIDFINRVEPDYVHFSIATPYPNTEFWEWVKRHGRFLTTDYRRFEREFIFETPEYPLSDRIKAVEIIERELGPTYGVKVFEQPL